MPTAAAEIKILRVGIGECFLVAGQHGVHGAHDVSPGVSVHDEVESECTVMFGDSLLLAASGDKHSQGMRRSLVLQRGVDQ